MRLTVARLGHLGDGLAEDADGRPVFVPRSLPGELVEGDPVAGRIAAPKIVAPSPHRVRPACPHYARCGGCALMHADDGFVAAWKEDVVRRALDAHGLSAPFRPMHVSPPASRRRAVLGGRRTRAGVIVGFHAPGSDLLTPVQACRILHPELRTALPVLERLTGIGGTRRGEISFTVTRSETGLDVAARGGLPAEGARAAQLAQEAARAGLARLTWNGELLAQNAAPILRFGGAAVALPPGAFLQATADGEAALRAAVLEAVGPAARRVADLFAGCGTFALPLAARGAVHAVEGDAAMIAALDAGWRGASGLKPVTTEQRDLFRRPLSAAELARFDAVVIDPPRQGAAAQTAEIARSAVPVVAAVSCNPVSFARDAATLCAAGFRLDWVQVVDQFRWSAHVELAARLSRPHMAPSTSTRPQTESE